MVIIEYIDLGHATWTEMVGGRGGKYKPRNIATLTYDDFDCMLKTYHDANSEHDWNPLYYTVNRPQCKKENWKTPNSYFNKLDYNYKLK